jgi:ATP-dependent Clp protease ATP-binding subunit ClpC
MHSKINIFRKRFYHEEGIALPETDDTGKGLTPGAIQLVDAAESIRVIARHDQLGINHWLLAIMETYGPSAEEMVKGLGSENIVRKISASLRNGETGPEVTKSDAIREAWSHAGRRGNIIAEEFDLVSTLLRKGGYFVDEYAILEHTRPVEAVLDEVYGTRRYSPRAINPTQTLDSLGTDLTHEALEGRIVGLAGREEEVRLVIETLCRRTKRNPILVGPPGVGKTAIVEGLAHKVVRGEVPDPLRNVRILSMSLTAVTAGTKYFGTLQEKVQEILKEAKQDGIVLFFDEVHGILGGGGYEGKSDIAAALKPVLARGDVAIIAATTDEEFRRFIEQDPALERRFQPIRVQQLSVEQTREVLKEHREDLQRLRSVEIPDEVLDRLLDYSNRCMRNRYFPDKALDLLEQCVANALTVGSKVVTPEGVSKVVERLVGMPLDAGKRLETMRRRISRFFLLSDADADALQRRLDVAMHGMDSRPNRPNAVVLLAGEAADFGIYLGQSIAESLCGGRDRLVVLDFGRFQEASDLRLLLGSPPSYLGYGDAVPLHKVKQIPWCVLLCENVDAAHQRVLGVLSQALREGFFTDGSGKRIYLSNAIVILTAMKGGAVGHPLGFNDSTGGHTGAREAVRARLGSELLNGIHLVCTERAYGFEKTKRVWVEDYLRDLSQRLELRGVCLSWESEVVNRLADRICVRNGSSDLERVLDEEVGPLLIGSYSPGSSENDVRLCLDATGIKPKMTPRKVKVVADLRSYDQLHLLAHERTA